MGRKFILSSKIRTFSVSSLQILLNSSPLLKKEEMLNSWCSKKTHTTKLDSLPGFPKLILVSAY